MIFHLDEAVDGRTTENIMMNAHPWPSVKLQLDYGKKEKDYFTQNP